MVVHVSLFYLKDASAAGQVVEALEKVPRQNPAVVTSQVGVGWGAPPPMPGMPDFADVGQILTFASEADAAAYARSEAHIALRDATDHLIQRVAAMDFVC